MQKQWRYRVLIVGLGAALAALLMAASGGTKSPVVLEIPAWTQVDHPLRAGLLKRHLVKLKVKENMLKDRQLLDHQYGMTRRYKVIALRRLLRMYPHAKKADVALLRFANGIVIPYPLKGKARKGKEAIYVATSWWSAREREWSSSFPPIRKANKAFRDTQPLQFSGHKLVLGEPWHPLVPAVLKRPPRAVRGFTPWRHADSLKGIAFSSRRLHRRAFRWARSRQEKKGQALFFASCQFCHGVNGIGASFGVDLVTPYPVYRYRRGMSLLWHLRYRSMTAIEHGAMMPAIKGMTRRDATALWYWLRAAARRSTKKTTKRRARRSKKAPRRRPAR